MKPPPGWTDEDDDYVESEIEHRKASDIAFELGVQPTFVSRRAIFLAERKKHGKGDEPHGRRS